MGALLLAWRTGDARFDAAGSIAIGVVLIVVAVFLAMEVKSLLVGEAADPDVERAVMEVCKDQKCVTRVFRLITVQQGPGEVMVAMKISVEPNLPSDRLSVLINEVEASLRAKRPEIRWCFIEPDLTDGAGSTAVKAAS
jgi:divalent metal cation (Fe/Co/Zn/Cd) transporter